MDGITLSIAEMRRFPYMTGKNERFCPSGLQGQWRNRTPIGGKMHKLLTAPLLCPLVPLSGIV